MENDTTTTPELESFTSVVVKSFAVSLATTAGMVAGLAAVGAVMNWRDRKNVTELTDETLEEK